MKKPLPIGVDNFKKIIEEGYCYIDKTMFIKELLDLKGFFVQEDLEKH